MVTGRYPFGAIVDDEVRPDALGNVLPLWVVAGEGCDERPIGQLCGAPTWGARVVAVQRGVSAFVDKNLL